MAADAHPVRRRSAGRAVPRGARRVAVVVAALALAFAPRGVEAQQVSPDSAIAAARAGGVVIACRHAITDHSQRENEATLSFDDPSTQRRLSEEGERQSVDMGVAFRALGIPIGEVIASPLQRARRMAELMFDRVTTDSLWFTRGNAYDRDRAGRLAVLSAPVASGNRVIISHSGTLGSVLETGDSFREGDCVVARPTGDGHEVVGVVPWRAWIEAAERERRRN